MDDIPSSMDRLVGRSSYGLLHWTLHHAEDRSLPQGPQGPQGVLQPSINIRSVQGLGKRELGLRGAKSWKFPAIDRTQFFGFPAWYVTSMSSCMIYYYTWSGKAIPGGSYLLLYGVTGELLERWAVNFNYIAGLTSWYHPVMDPLLGNGFIGMLSWPMFILYLGIYIYISIHRII